MLGQRVDAGVCQQRGSVRAWTPGIGLNVECQSAVGRHTQSHQKCQSPGLVGSRWVGPENQCCRTGWVDVQVGLCPGFLAGQQGFNGFFLRFQEGFQRLDRYRRCIRHLGHIFKSAVGGKAVIAPGEGVTGGQPKYAGQGHRESFHLKSPVPISNLDRVGARPCVPLGFCHASQSWNTTVLRPASLALYIAISAHFRKSSALPLWSMSNATPMLTVQ